MISEDVQRALQSGRLVDITTTGRKSGKQHRIEIPYFNVDGRCFIIGDPRTHDEARTLRPRDWYANLLAEPRFTLHLKAQYKLDLGAMVEEVLNYDDPVEADVPCRATPVHDQTQRRRIVEAVLPSMGARGFDYDLDDWVEHGPMVEFEVEA